MVVRVRKAPGGFSATLDSPAQGVMGRPATHVVWRGRLLSFDVPSVHGHYKGVLSANGQILKGTWSQGVPLALDLHRLSAAAAATVEKKAAAARPRPVPLARLGAVLKSELAPLRGSALAPGSGLGLVVGVVANGQRRIFAFGAARPDSMFEIGSVTKTFTGLLLARLVAQHRVRLRDAVAQFLPPGSAPAAAHGAGITLGELATQHSGLPPMPDNFNAVSPANPYAGYAPARLLSYLRQRGLAHPAGAPFVYSNLGYGLLGYALARAVHNSYAALLRQEITGPLALHNTVIRLSAAQRRRLLPGHDAAGHVTANWTFTAAFAGAGALRSTAGDLLTYLEANLHPPAAMASAFALQHRPRAAGPPGMKVGLGWIYVPASGSYWHDGGTGGYSSFVFFNPRRGLAVVALANRGPIGSGRTPLPDVVVVNVGALLEGTPAPRIR
ncbi:MAG: serine hydrolase domain-containing protein [Terriglobales bacterium]